MMGTSAVGYAADSASPSRSPFYRAKRACNLGIPPAAVGVVASMTIAIEFALWAAALHAGPTRDGIMARFGVSRPTAYRWLRAWNGQEGSMLFGIRFARWCLDVRPTDYGQIMAEFGVSRATAYRWRRAWFDQVEKGIA